MNARTLVLIGAIALVGIGAIMMLSDFFSPPAPVAQMKPAVALTQIQPYTVITQDMVGEDTPITQKDAKTLGAWPVELVIGKMSTNLISPGDRLTALNALPIDEVRFTSDPNLEIVSFNASVDRMVAGKVKPGSLINLYGYGRNDKTNEPFTVLVEPRVWVVAVSASGQNVSNATVVPDPKTGKLTVSGGEQNRPATTLTVAVPPEKAFNIINSFGAESMNAWVTLAANQSVTAANMATPVPQATATPGLPLNIALTATALYLKTIATVPPSGPRTGDGWGANR
jgi:hypothetical protein